MALSSLTIGCVQADLAWENPEENRRKLSLLFEQAIQKQKLDLLVLPEMFTTGYTMNVASLAEPVQGPTLEWMKEKSFVADALLIGTIIVKEANQFFNRLYCVFPSGEFITYDKRHLFRMAGEHNFFTAGKKRIIFEWRGFRICPLICYDLRFPVFSRNNLKGGEGYDLLIYVANWPERRIFHWTQLLIARAIENQSYVVGTNRVGVDGNGIYYNGQSAIISPLGEYLLSPTDKQEVGIASISLDTLSSYRNNFPAFQDADTFSIVY
ncbi:MAG: amidohydrolase [Bacteroidia bacterium]|nr:amidohydrolase [Bacteroidia bacterium]MDW8158218.1 amidohydrolase [Bacteroidia bacterium]